MAFQVFGLLPTAICFRLYVTEASMFVFSLNESYHQEKQTDYVSTALNRPCFPLRPVKRMCVLPVRCECQSRLDRSQTNHTHTQRQTRTITRHFLAGRPGVKKQTEETGHKIIHLHLFGVWCVFTCELNNYDRVWKARGLLQDLGNITIQLDGTEICQFVT